MSDNIDDFIKNPDLPEPETLDEIKHDIAIISEAIERCEKMLQHLAIINMSGGNASELDEYMSKHLMLTGMRKTLHKKMKAITERKSDD